ncbi:hypothetical protein HPB51_027346 [Rhipicephalus microplus]|uniref:Uncharacterized protein n=1 Tax=Rhipicephalus microplus TaxID=6941 RepID=A0A9J6D0G1_RHIMP|nr:hypothetical protein HPB51_027346 [Rhipicephalus microplus]
MSPTKVSIRHHLYILRYHEVARSVDYGSTVAAKVRATLLKKGEDCVDYDESAIGAKSERKINSKKRRKETGQRTWAAGFHGCRGFRPCVLDARPVERDLDASKMSGCGTSTATPRTGPPPAPARERTATGSVRVDKCNFKQQVIRSSKRPLLQRNDFKIVIRPRGGLDVATTAGTVRLASAIYRAANVPAHEAGEDTVCSNNYQNIIVVSTPHVSHADKHRQLQAITIGNRHTEVSAYETAPDNTVKGIIRGIQWKKTSSPSTPA